MGISPSVASTCDSNDQLVSEQLTGDAYEVVKAVKSNLPLIVEVNENIDSIHADAVSAAQTTALTTTDARITEHGPLREIGTWDATENIPAIAAASPLNKGHFYKVVTAGSTEIDGISDWEVGDWLISNGVTWSKLDSTGKFTDNTPRRLSHGIRTPIRTDREAHTILQTLHTTIQGRAGVHAGNPLGTTGGYGYPEFFVNNPSMDPRLKYSFGWARAQARKAGGGILRFATYGKFDVRWREREILEDENLTFYAPAANVTFWCDRLEGIFLIRNTQNIIFYNIYLRPFPGPINGTAIGEASNRAETLIDIDFPSCSRIAFLNCEFRHPSWHCLDISSADVPPAPEDPECLVTIQNCIFWDAVQAHLIGTVNSTLDPADYTDDDSVRKCFVSIIDTIYANCLQRTPKVLGNAVVEMHRCLLMLQAYPTEYLDFGTTTYADLMESVYGGGVQDGGWLRMTDILAVASHPSGVGRNASLVYPVVHAASGRIDTVNCVAENGLIFETRDGALIPAAPYVIDPAPIPASRPAREAWVAELWANAGARTDSAPEGLYRWVDGSTVFPNGETAHYDYGRGLTGMWERVDALAEYPMLDEEPLDKIDAIPYSGTRAVGYQNGSLNDAAISPATLDISGINSGYISVMAGLGANIRDIVAGEYELQNGSILNIVGSSSSPVTLKQLIRVAVTTMDTPANTVVLSGAHGRVGNGFAVSFTSTGELPAPLEKDKTYYAIYVDGTSFKLCPTLADAIAVTNIINIAGTGTGVHTATVGNLNLPNGTDIILNNTGKNLQLRCNADGLFSPPIGLVSSVAGRNGDVTLSKTDVGLANVDNTSDANKPVSTAQAAALAQKVHTHTKSQITDLPELASGTYVPVITNVGAANTTAVAPLSAFYTRIGNVVLVVVEIDHTATAAGDTTLQITLPIASNLANSGDAVGNGVSNDTATAAYGPVYAAPGTDAALYRFKATTAGASRKHYVSFSYKVLA